MKAHFLPGIKLLFALSLVGLPLCTLAASFDCGKAVTSTEKLICSDAETSAMDGKLQQTYKTALATTDAYGKKALAKEQRNWITYTRGICQDTACLRQVYTDRIAVLARNEKIIVNESISACKLPGKGNECVTVVPYRDPNEQISSFNQALVAQKLSGRIIGCSRLIDLPLGTVGGEDTFGGICVLQDGRQRKDVKICYGNMGGAFQKQPASPQDASDNRLIEFTYTQCFASPTEL